MPMWKWEPVLDPAEGRPVLFLDRDGVIIRDRHYLSDPDLVELIPGVPEAMIKAREAGFLLVGVSNQSGIGRGRFTEADFVAVMTRLDEMQAATQAPFDGFFYCPHGPDQNCSCRKPLPGMLDECSQKCSWQAPGSWVIGDKMSDVQLGRRAGLGSALVRTGYGREQEEKVRAAHGNDPDVFVADDLNSAVHEILQRAKDLQP